jgi:hypothetical protein
VDVEQGQADGSVLQAQTGSLVYFATMVNDVYAYFLTGVKDGAITPGTSFPTSSADLAQITSFASGHGVTFPDPNALAIEVKSAWVEASTVPNPTGYITIVATIPTYDTTSPTTWPQNGQKTVTLALVGMHVVGSTAGHPEMIWATFEHFANAPRDTYQYVNTSGTTVTVNQNTAANWLFCTTGCTSPFNAAHMQFTSPDIVAVTPNTISPSNTIRRRAFGGGFDQTPNPLDPTTAASNTEIISLNNSVAGMMVSGDVRNNYIMTGATWTAGGAAPTCPFAGNLSCDEVGTSVLANTTMETYVQGPDNTQATGMNCLDCHASNTVQVSHVFSAIKALF